jgi:hypothetical protein
LPIAFAEEVNARNIACMKMSIWKTLTAIVTEFFTWPLDAKDNYIKHVIILRGKNKRSRAKDLWGKIILTLLRCGDF